MNTVVRALRFGWATRRAWWFTATARTGERFARTVLGSFWLGLSNLLSLGVIALIYGAVFKVKDFNSYLVYLGIGLVVWNSMATAMQSASNLFRLNAANIMSTSTHPIFYALEEWVFQLQNFFQSFGLVLLVLSFFHSGLIPHLFTSGLIPLLTLSLFLFWVPLLLCLLGARYEDFFQLVPIILQLMFLVTPILYEKKTLGSLGWTAELNPMYWVLSSLRNALLHGQLELGKSLLLLLVNLLGVYLSLCLLERERHKLPFLV